MKIKKSTCCGEPVIYAVKKYNPGLKQGYYCSGNNGCGKWCEVLEREIMVSEHKENRSFRACKNHEVELKEIVECDQCDFLSEK